MHPKPSDSSFQPFSRRKVITTAALATASTLLGGAFLGSPAQAVTPNVSAGGSAAAKSGPISVAYVEVNTDQLANVGRYSLNSNGANAFDIAVIFAANINYDGSNAYLYLNDNVQKTLDNAATQIKPLQAKGIKVTLSILGNHQGAGFANFPNQAAANAFASQVADVVAKYNLDGVDLDDEYAEYGNNGTGQPNNDSFVQLLSALRQKMPNKLLTFYNIGPSADHLSSGGVNAGSLLDYAWNPYYGTWQVPNVPGMKKSQLSPAAVDIRNTSSSTSTSLAQRTVKEGYGVFLTYNLGNGNYSKAVSAFTNTLYGSSAVYQ